MRRLSDRVGVGCDHHAPGSCRVRTSSAAAVSASVRLTTPLVAKPSTSTTAFVTRPRVDLSPTRPVHDAGMRIDPPPSSACATGAIPAMTATPAPLDEPPGVRSGSHGLREMPCASLSVNGTAPNSDVVVLPSGRKPASVNRRTIGSDFGCGERSVASEPYVVGQPWTWTRSLIGSGTPWNGGSSSGEHRSTASAAAFAAVRTSSSARKQKALNFGSNSAMRSR